MAYEQAGGAGLACLVTESLLGRTERCPFFFFHSFFFNLVGTSFLALDPRFHPGRSPAISEPRSPPLLHPLRTAAFPRTCARGPGAFGALEPWLPGSW